MRVAKLVIVSSVVAGASGCYESYGDHRERIGTSSGASDGSWTGDPGSGWGSGGSDGGSDGASDGGSDGASDGGSDGLTEFDTSTTCQVYLKKKSTLENPPYKDGQYWDQGGWGACAYIALINANIDSGANDANGAFEKRVRDCLKEEGITDADIADGLDGFELEDIADCKEDAMEDDGYDVDVDCNDLGLWFDDLDDYCEDIQAALDADGSAVVSFQLGDEGHSLTVVSIECSGSVTTLHLRDPNFPNGQIYVVTVDEDDVTSVSPSHFFLTTESSASRVYLEEHED